MAAAVHATWNALVKAGSDRLALIRVMFLTQAAISACLIPFVPLPDPQSWLLLATSPLFSVGYVLFLNWAYQAGDLSQIYPLARGTAPMLVVLISTWFLGEHLDWAGKTALVMIVVGVASLSLSRSPGGRRDLRPLLLAFGTSACTAGYTIVDGIGARLAGNAHGYVVWVSLVSSVATIICVQWLLRGRARPVSRRSLAAGIASGAMSYVSYWLVVWAMTFSSIALVSALRETGIVFAVLIGVLFLKERLNLIRAASIAMTFFGAAVLRFSR
jgi:drug/metabolite transporter (DMT)-like permease